ncbi:MAG: hypothetical protein Q8R15_00780 [Candidatus Micrarchaeota archaeon]|nr:hypothetical protein [Candidatus Micrarchaeota archaeon]
MSLKPLSSSQVRRIAIARVSAHLTENGLEHKVLRKEIRVPVIGGKNQGILNDLQGKLSRRGLVHYDKHQALQSLLAERSHHPHVLVGLIPFGYKRNGNFQIATSERIVFHPLISKAPGKK